MRQRRDFFPVLPLHFAYLALNQRVGLGGQGRHHEGLPRALRVAGANDGGVDVQEPVLLEEEVGGERECVSDPGDRGYGVRPRPQVELGPQELERRLLFGDWVGGAVTRANVRDFRALELKLLLGSLGRSLQVALDRQGASRRRDLLQLLHPRRRSCLLRDHDLQVHWRGPVVELDKSKGSSSCHASCFHPPGHNARQ